MNLLNGRKVLAFSVAMALTFSLTACGGGGGGGGNVRPSSTPPAPAPSPSSPAPAPAPAPPPAPAPSGPAPTTLTGSPTPLPTPIIQQYSPLRSQLDPVNVPAAWAYSGSPIGDLGQNVKVGILDSGAQPLNSALLNRITWFKDYVDPGNTVPQDEDGHGTMMAEIIGGVPNQYGSGGAPFSGGIAQEASLYIARIGDATGGDNVALAQQALSDLAAQGVKLINNSYGSTTSITSQGPSDPQVTQRYSIFSSTVANGQLMVWAAGNSGMSQPTIEAGLPYYEPSLQNNWLAVVNVALNANGQVTGLDTDATSNACGVAAPWCLAAPGYIYVLPVDNTKFSTGAGDGTSGSAAVVTGIAALVWQRFPFFTATNVQQTLLGTATNLGSPDYYGYGLVNAAAAVGGPGQLNWGAFAVNIPSGVQSTFFNNMSGSGSIELDGSGNLTLYGKNTIGGVTVNGGFLFLEGSNTFTNPTGATVNGGTLVVVTTVNSNITVNQSGALTGEVGNVINGNVTNGGMLYTVNGPMQINGNYTVVAGQPAHGPNINTQIQLGNPLTVSGTATFNKSLLVVDIPSGYTPKAEELLLTANGGIVGAFGPLQVNGSVYYTGGTVSYTSTQVNVALGQASVTSLAQVEMPATATVQQTAQHIQTALTQANQWASTDTGSHQAFLDATGDFLHVSSMADAEASISSLSGQLLASSQSLTLQQAGIINRTVADRLVDIDEGNAQQGAWFQGTGADGDIARSGYATGNYSGGGSIAGFDMKLAEDFMLGVGLDWNHLSSNYTLQAGTNTSRSTGAMLYAKWLAGDAYVSGRLGEDWIHSDTSRWGVLGVVPEAISSSRNDQMTSAYLEAGYNMKSDAWTTTPFVSAGLEHLDRGAINEQGAGGFGIAAPSETFNQSYAQLGARLAYHWNWGGGQISLKGYALYQRIMGGHDLGFTAAYAGAPNATFELEGVNSPRNSAWVGAGVNAVMNNHWSWFLNLDGQFASGGSKARTVSGGVRYQF